MVSVLDQPWWVDVGVILLFITTLSTVYVLLQRNYCGECGVKATRRHLRRYYCERCFERYFDHGATVLPATRPSTRPTIAPAAAVNGVHLNGNGKLNGTVKKVRMKAGRRKTNKTKSKSRSH